MSNKQIHFRISGRELQKAKTVCRDNGIKLNDLLRFIIYNIAKTNQIPLQIKKVG